MQLVPRARSLRSTRRPLSSPTAAPTDKRGRREVPPPIPNPSPTPAQEWPGYIVLLLVNARCVGFFVVSDRSAHSIPWRESEANGIWKLHHRRLRDLLQVTPTYPPYTNRRGLAPRLTGVPPSARMHSLIDLAFCAAPPAMRKAGRGDWFVDPSQCGSRKGTFGPGIGTVATSSCIFVVPVGCSLGATGCS